METLKLTHGDCLLEMSNIPDKSVDMILTDLPYGALNRGNRSARWDRQLPLDKVWAHYERIIKDNGAIVLFGQGRFTAQLMQSNTELWRYNLVWDKVLVGGFLNAKRMPLRSHEDILVFYRKAPTYNPQMSEGKPLHGKGKSYKEKRLTNNCYGSIHATDDTRKGSTAKFPTSILRFAKPHPSMAVHPTEKPVALLEWLIKTFTNEGETVLDSCMGSGSTGVACKNTKRNFIGIESDERYFQIALKRMQ